MVYIFQDLKCLKEEDNQLDGTQEYSIGMALVVNLNLVFT